LRLPISQEQQLSLNPMEQEYPSARVINLPLAQMYSTSIIPNLKISKAKTLME
jgi:hypothetical protein